MEEMHEIKVGDTLVFKGQKYIVAHDPTTEDAAPVLFPCGGPNQPPCKPDTA